MSDDDELEAEEAAIAAYLESLSAEALRKRLTDLAARYEPIHRRLLTTCLLYFLVGAP